MGSDGSRPNLESVQLGASAKPSSGMDQGIVRPQVSDRRFGRWFGSWFGRTSRGTTAKPSIGAHQGTSHTPCSRGIGSDSLSQPNSGETVGHRGNRKPLGVRPHAPSKLTGVATSGTPNRMATGHGEPRVSRLVQHSPASRYIFSDLTSLSTPLGSLYPMIR